MGVSVYLKRFSVSGLIKTIEHGEVIVNTFAMQVYARSKTDAKYIAIGRKVTDYGECWVLVDSIAVE